MTETSPLPIAALDTHIGVLGRTGTGKTYTARGMVERLLDDGRQVVIVDPTGAWFGLRTHYGIPIFGGVHGDVPITDASGEAVAGVVIEQRTSAIVDLSLLARQSGAAMRRFMAAFVARLKDKDKGAIWLVLDEADEFLPQVLSPDMTHLFGDLKWIVRRGRVAGWRVMMITQRPQDIAKSVLTQIGTLVAHRLTAPQDRKAIEEWVKGNADTDAARQVLDTLASLDVGEAWVWWPDGGLLTRQHMPAITSFDSGATPDANAGQAAQPDLAAIDISGVVAVLQLPARVGTSAIGGVPVEDGGLAEARDEWTIERAIGQRQIDALTLENTALREIVGQIEAALSDFRRIIPAIEVPASGRRMPGGDEGQTEGRQVMMSAAPRVKPQHQRQKPQGVTAGENATGLNASARKMLDMLDRIAPARVPWASLAAMVGNKARGGNFNAARKAMRESGRIMEDGDLVRSAVNSAGGMSRADAITLWKSVLTNPAPRMIDALADGGLTREGIGAALGIVPRGGNFNGGIAQLVRNGVVVDRSGRLTLTEPIPGEGR